MGQLPASVEELGPVQVLVVAFEQTSGMRGEVLAELERLRQADLVRLIDLLIVRRDVQGEIEILQRTDLTGDEAKTVGSLLRALFGADAEEHEAVSHTASAGVAELEGGHVFQDVDTWYLADAVPPGTAAAVALLEHRWAAPLRTKILDAGGSIVADEWIAPADLVAAIGISASVVAS